jgi:glycosyltransferase involved in cell wall biosynthesis
MTNQPLVSIIIPVYNGAAYLRDAVDSALAQTYPNCEVIVVNDGSDDDGATDAVAKSYGNRIRYFTKSNGGVASALNVGLKHMRGKYFSWLSHDDWYYPDKIARQVAAAEAIDDPSVIISGGVDCYLQLEGRVYQTTAYIPLETPKDVLEAFFSSTINFCALLVHKSLVDSLGGFDETQATTQDYDLLIKAIYAGCQFHHISKPLICSRHHSGQGTLTMRERHLRELECLYQGAVQLLRESLLDLPSDDIANFERIMRVRGLGGAAQRLRSLRDFVAFRDRDPADTRPVIWLYWENPPGLSTPYYINECWKSIEYHCRADFHICLVDEHTAGLYCSDLHPQWRAFNKIAHRADYLRFKLLHTYGGIWLDSDVIIFRSLKAVAEQIERHGFVCTGHQDSSKATFPLIGILGAAKGNALTLAMVKGIEQYIDTHLCDGIQPGWDDIGGHMLARLLESHGAFIYDVHVFCPLPVYRDPETLLRPYNREVRCAFAEAFGQVLANSVYGTHFETALIDAQFKNTALHAAFALGCGRQPMFARPLWRRAISKSLKAGRTVARELLPPLLREAIGLAMRRRFLASCKVIVVPLAPPVLLRMARWGRKSVKAALARRTAPVVQKEPEEMPVVFEVKPPVIHLRSQSRRTARTSRQEVPEPVRTS